MLTPRDRRIIRFIEDFKIATTSQIYELFFGTSNRRCRQRLKELCNQGHMSRERGCVSMEYIYFIGKKPAQIEHHMTRAQFYITADREFELSDFQPEYTIGKCRADAYFEVKSFGHYFPAFLEVQLSGGFDQQKYETLFNSGLWLERWRTFPLIVVVTNRALSIKPSKLKFIVLDAQTLDIKPLKQALNESYRMAGCL